MLIGFTNTLNCKLFNTAPVPMSYVLRIPNDGDAKVKASQTVQESMDEKSSGVSVAPREFTVHPASGMLRANASIDVSLEFTSNTLKTYELGLVVDVEHVGEEVLRLPIHAK